MQSFDVPECPWDDNAMDFDVGLPRTWRGKDVVRVVLAKFRILFLSTPVTLPVTWH
jgi:hypothetical protein